MKTGWVARQTAPPVMPGGADGGGRNDEVMQMARHLASFGHQVDLATRRDEDRPVLRAAGGRSR